MANARDIANRVPITIALMLATVMNSLDTTIANVALPHIEGSVGAAPDQITWVLTAYLVSAAIMTPLSGWLSVRLGRKWTFAVSIAGFTIASMLCGVATNVGQIVGFRFLQGMFGAALIPLSQAVVLDLYPPRQLGQVMALWGAAAILGPIFGPFLGGWLTDNLTWRWCFYINLPVGILALTGVLVFMSPERQGQARPFDFLGFGALTLFIGALQLIVDRGPDQDWFSSTEIWIYTVIAILGLWVFIVQTVTARNPFFDRALALDRNFVTCTVFGFFIGVLLFSTMALLPPMMQQLMGYSALESGVASMPRGLGSFVAMFAVGRLIGRVDTRLILATGLSLSGLSLWQMSHFDLTMGEQPIIVAGVIQGFGIGLIFVPLSTLAYATLPAQFRPEGTAVYTLVRNLGASIGISIMQALWTANTAVVHAGIVGRLDPASPVARAGLGQVMALGSRVGGEILNDEITRQAAMVAYIDDFRLMMLATIAITPLLFIMRTPGMARAEMDHVAVE